MTILPKCTVFEQRVIEEALATIEAQKEAGVVVLKTRLPFSFSRQTEAAILLRYPNAKIKGNATKLEVVL
ncbi:MAG: hypothetical protein ACI35O_12885 [Bacillaceae bacterium]